MLSLRRLCTQVNVTKVLLRKRVQVEKWVRYQLPKSQQKDNDSPLFLLVFPENNLDIETQITCETDRTLRVRHTELCT